MAEIGRPARWKGLKKDSSTVIPRLVKPAEKKFEPMPDIEFEHKQAESVDSFTYGETLNQSKFGVQLEADFDLELLDELDKLF